MRGRALASLLLLACGPSIGPTVDPVGAVTAPVGVELDLPLHGTTSDGSGVSFDFSSPDLPDLKMRRLPATMTNYANGEAVFRWTPLATDVGAHELDVLATGAGVTRAVPVALTVIPGPDDAPVFREPAGDGTTLPLSVSPCASIDVVVDDADQPTVSLSLAPPLVEGAKILTTGPHAAQVRFCPSLAALQQTTIYVLTLDASDGTHDVRKTYTVVVLPAPGGDCTTMPPSVTVMPHGDVATTGDLHVGASATDDVGVTAMHLLWTTTAPADASHPDPSEFSAIDMAMTAGTPTSGTWDGVLPNPVVSQPSGATATIWYLVAAHDDDPPAGCSHDVLAPSAGALSFTVTRP